MPFRPSGASGTGYLPPIRIIRSDAFRLAALFAFLFLALTGVLIGTVLFIVEGTQRSALKSANDADIATVTNGFLDEGVPEAVEVVRQRLGSSRLRALRPDCYMVIENERGERLAGNLPVLPPKVGVFTINLPPSIDARTSAAPARGELPIILGRGIEVTKGVYLFVGRDTALLTTTRDRILDAFMWVVLGAVVIAVAGGLFLGFRFMRRVDAVAATCQAIIGGRLDERIPLTGREHEWDRLARAINEMLDRISGLLENLRQVSSDVAHDLRTPLARLRNRLEQARTNSVSVAEYSAAIAAAIDDMDQVLAMFSALLRISQVEAGTRQSSFTLVSLSQILEGLYQLYVPVAEDHGHSLASAIQEGICIHGDAELLTQMFSNLLENAIRHTPRHTHIQITLQSHGKQAIAAVSDDGPGIDPSEREKVLRRFYRVSTSRSSPGHGLGLALVAAIAQLHHATLTLSSANPGLKVTTIFPFDSVDKDGAPVWG